MKITCPKCHLDFDPVRWSEIDPQLSSRYCVCDNCIDDRMRHKIIDNYFGYRTATNVTIENFNILLHLMVFSDRFNFYSWFLREASKFSLMSHSVYHSIQTSSPYPHIIGPIIDFICKKYGNEFFDHLNNCWANYSDLEKNSILNSLPNSRLFVAYKDEKKLEADLGSISSIFNKLFDETFSTSLISEKDFLVLINVVRNNTNQDSWFNFAEGLNKKGLIQLIKSFVYIENIQQLSCDLNSSPTISLCKSLFGPYKNLIKCNKLENDLITLINWILRNSKNRYLPFGENNLSSTSLEEYTDYFDLCTKANNEISSMEKTLLQKKNAILNEIVVLQTKINVINKEIDRKEKSIGHKDKSLIRISKLKKIANMNPVEKLQFISIDDKPLQYYPGFLINIDKKYIGRLDPETKSLLNIKLKSVTKGYYKTLTKILST